MSESLKYQRMLIVIPIIHTEADLGSLGEKVKHSLESTKGKEYWSKHVKTVEGLWDAIRTWIFSLSLTYEKVRLYQDGLPVCNMELQIVQDVADRGSRNHSILLDLIARGAILMGTEDPKLLLQEYAFQQNEIVPNVQVRLDLVSQRLQQSQKLLLDRDLFIADQINSTLQIGETGLLFIGKAHQVEPHLAPDIFTRLIPNMQFSNIQGFTK
ncbi:MAG: hypothetical protein WCJ40_03200 [Planctomycetota bacterium]